MEVRRRLVIVAGAASAACLALLLARMLRTGETTHGFLAWNLALAWIPMVVALRLVRPSGSPARRTVLAATWLLFLPNAPYLVTDLVHLPARADPRYWIDLTLLVGAAGTGLLLGTASLHLVHDALRRRHGDAVGWAVVGAVVPLVGIGIALGRFARWNSWDLVLAPQTVAGDVLMWAGAPLAHVGPMAAAALLAGLVGAAYLVMHLLLDPWSREPHPGAGDRRSGRPPAGPTS